MESLDESFARIDGFVRGTRTAVFVRRVDNLLLIRPEKTLGVNPSAAAIIEALYARGAQPAAATLARLSRELRVDLPRLVEDTRRLLDAVAALMRDDFSPRPGVNLDRFNRKIVLYPILAEIALTYGCQNRCAFCYAASPYRDGEHRQMTTAQVKLVMERIFHQGHVPSLSFTGGEATLRRDLPELVTHGQRLGLRVNLISNGIRAADLTYARVLVDAGLASAQISIEADGDDLHDRIVGRPGSFAQTVAGIRNLRSLGIHVHTNTTLCQANLERAEDIVRFVARDLGLPTMSMNMLIRTGMALDERSAPVSYPEIARRLPSLLATAKQEGLKFVWYSPIPYCIANPVLLGQGAKSCACVDGILSVDPAGNVLPCSSFRDGIGSLLEQDYETIRASRAAAYWRERRYLPPPCEGCPEADVCAGACPLYWDAVGSFAELPRANASDDDARRRWEKERAAGRSFGVPLPAARLVRHPASPTVRA